MFFLWEPKNQSQKKELELRGRSAAMPAPIGWHRHTNARQFLQVHSLSGVKQMTLIFVNLLNFTFMS